MHLCLRRSGFLIFFVRRAGQKLCWGKHRGKQSPSGIGSRTQLIGGIEQDRSSRNP
jgi:hypothetical protein